MVVGHGVNDDGRAADAIPFITNFLVLNTFEVSGSLVDIALDSLRRQIGRLGFFHSESQTRVNAQITPAQTRRHHDLADHTGPHLAPFFVLAALAVLNIGPFAVSCHAKTLRKFVTLRVRLYFSGSP